MAVDVVLSLLADELRRRADDDGEREGYARGVRDAVTAFADLTAGTPAAETLAAALRATTGADGTEPADRSAVDPTASWLAGFALARTQHGDPVPDDVRQAAAIASGSVTVVDRARSRIDGGLIVDEGNRLRSQALLLRCELVVRVSHGLRQPMSS